MRRKEAENLLKNITRNHKNADIKQELDYYKAYKTVESLAKEIIDNPDNANTYFLLGCLLIKYYDMKETSAKVLKIGLAAEPEHKMMKDMLEHIQHDLYLDDFCRTLERG